jgi:(E)-4-hydroxy-3-methylbut-2-enyl-diphosphate synthase
MARESPGSRFRHCRGSGTGLLFKKGNIIRKLPENQLVEALVEEIEKMEDKR